METDNGARASAMLYSIVEDKNLRFLDDLMPWSPWVQKEYPSKFKRL
ncbi:MAG: hypothetical protein II994_02665 [Lachnospiraceae bacterium]|nr:hypothetical protein [Lachnospiraceae bacterium]